MKVNHVGGTLSIVAGRELVKFTIVPEVAGGLSAGLAGTHASGIIGGAVHGEVLAVATTTRSTKNVSECDKTIEKGQHAGRARSGTSWR